MAAPRIVTHCTNRVVWNCVPDGRSPWRRVDSRDVVGSAAKARTYARGRRSYPMAAVIAKAVTAASHAGRPLLGHIAAGHRPDGPAVVASGTRESELAVCVRDPGWYGLAVGNVVSSVIFNTVVIAVTLPGHGKSRNVKTAPAGAAGTFTPPATGQPTPGACCGPSQTGRRNRAPSAICLRALVMR